MNNKGRTNISETSNNPDARAVKRPTMATRGPKVLIAFVLTGLASSSDAPSSMTKRQATAPMRTSAAIRTGLKRCILNTAKFGWALGEVQPSEMPKHPKSYMYPNLGKRLIIVNHVAVRRRAFLSILAIFGKAKGMSEVAKANPDKNQVGAFQTSA